MLAGEFGSSGFEIEVHLPAYNCHLEIANKIVPVREPFGSAKTMTAGDTAHKDLFNFGFNSSVCNSDHISSYDPAKFKMKISVIEEDFHMIASGEPQETKQAYNWYSCFPLFLDLKASESDY